MRSFDSLSEREILSLAITQEEEDSRIYTDIAEGLKADYPASAEVFRLMQGEEETHRRRLIEIYRTRFGEHIPLIRQTGYSRVYSSPTAVVGHGRCGDRIGRGNWLSHGDGNAAFYEAAMKRTTRMRAFASCSGIWRTMNASTTHLEGGAQLGSNELTPDVRQQEDDAKTAALRASDRPARAGGIDGWLGVDARAVVCRGVCHAQSMGRFRASDGGVNRCGHQHGIRRGAVR